MAEPTPSDSPGKEATPPRSFLLWHAVVGKPLPADLRDAREKERWDARYAALTELWNALAARLGLDTGLGSRPPEFKEFPAQADLEPAEEYTYLAFRRQPTLPDNDYAYVYVEHDVVGVVALIQSAAEHDFDALEKRLPAECARIPALWRFVTLGMFTDRPALPETLAEAVYDPEGFCAEPGFTLWNLKPEQEGVARLLAAVPTEPKEHWDREFRRFLVGPEKFVCPPLLEYQVHSAKVRWMATSFNAAYGHGGAGSLRRRRQEVDAEVDAALRSGAADVPTLLLQQQQEGGLTVMHRDLKAWLISLQIAAHHLGRLQPRARAEGKPASGFVA